MTEETVHIQPAIPSRAAQTPASPFQQPAFIENPSPGTEHAPAPPKRKRPAKKKAKMLPAAEIRKINAKRKKNLKAATPVPKKRKAKKRAPAQYGTAAQKQAAGRGFAASRVDRPKNPNRPLEMKNQLSAVLSMVGTLQKAELVFFSQAVPAMQALSRSGRKRVIAALQQVYG